MASKNNNKDVYAILGLLAKMRGPEGTKGDNIEGALFFDDCIQEAWQLFDFKDKVDRVSLEAFMIEAIICAINPDPDKLSKKRYKVAMRRKDISLLSFGLLDDFYYISEDGTRSLASERYEKYFQKNMRDFVAIIYFDSSLSDCYNIDDYGRKAYNLLFKDDERCRKILAGYLSKEENYQRCFEEGVKNHIKEIKHEDGGIERQINLPPPCFTIDNFRHIDNEPESTQSETTTEEKTQKRTVIECIKAIKIPLTLVLLLLIFVGGICWWMGKNSSTPTDSQSADGSAPQGDIYTTIKTEERLALPFGVTYEKTTTTETQYNKTTILEPPDE